MTWLVVTASLLAAHVTGAIALVAPTLGNIGTAAIGIDHSITAAVDLRNYVQAKRAAHKKVVTK